MLVQTHWLISYSTGLVMLGSLLFAVNRLRWMDFSARTGALLSTYDLEWQQGFPRA